MADTWVTDMTHFLDAAGSVPARSGPEVGVRDHLGSIVAFVTSRDVTGDERSPVRCRRRPKRQPCRGWIRASLDSASRQVLWLCPVCGDNGRISGWEGTPWDLGDAGLRRVRSSVVWGRFTNDRAAPAVEPRFTGPALRFWNAIEAGIRVRLLNNVWCSCCVATSSMQLIEGRVKRGDLVLSGRCIRCGEDVARVVERN